MIIWIIEFSIKRRLSFKAAFISAINAFQVGVYNNFLAIILK